MRVKQERRRKPLKAAFSAYCCKSRGLSEIRGGPQECDMRHREHLLHSQTSNLALRSNDSQRKLSESRNLPQRHPKFSCSDQRSAEEELYSSFHTCVPEPHFILSGPCVFIASNRNLLKLAEGKGYYEVVGNSGIPKQA